ncbi:hypothetical protein B0H21DRAFT_743135 [Amylocystis lapponica]|nr:hypothetical protein B0H21DRAFT_743135 [Amylocystis lapponica]
MSDLDGSHEPYEHNSSRPHSIDLTFELERQLDDESLPSSPHAPRPQSLDTNVLASIVTQLRMSLEGVTKERDSFAEQLATIQSRESNSKDALHTVTERCLHLETELAAARDLHKEDEDAIAMLRSKVEESRRALMRLQTESRRMSQASNLTLDLSRAGQPLFSGPPTSKRASFTPLTGTSAGLMGHRRISSVSDSGVLSAPAFSADNQWPGTPRSGDVLQFSPPVAAAGHSKRMSGMFSRGAAPPDFAASADAAELLALRKELDIVKDQLEESKHELGEIQEAREASEMCVQALRTFIAENGVGEQMPAAKTHSAKLPSISTGPVHEDGGASGRKGSNASRWGFKLWNSDGNTTPIAPSPVSAGVLPPSSPPPTAPLSRKLGGLFSSRTTSVSSTASSLRPLPNRESVYNGSDTSSIADSTPEPISPASSMPQASVLVQDGSGDSLVYVSNALAEGAKAVEPSPAAPDMVAA